jgi:hypothetical protein
MMDTEAELIVLGDYGHVPTPRAAMPYWNISCLWCLGVIIDALLECVPAAKRSDPAYRRLFDAEPAAAQACPYCGGLIGFDDDGNPQRPLAGWPVFRHGLAELEAKKLADGEPTARTLNRHLGANRDSEIARLGQNGLCC